MMAHDETNAAHRAECAECAALWTELEAISAEAKRLPLLPPSRDLWDGIEARLGGAAGAGSTAPSATNALAAGGRGDAGSNAATGHAARRARQRWFGRPALRLSAAAAALVATTATATWQLAAARSGTTAPTTAAAGPPAADGVAERSAAATVREASYGRDLEAMDLEIRALQQLLAERRAELDPATIAVLERSLALIDTAIAESAAALANDPASQFLAAQLARSYTTKLTLLRSTATMPLGT